MSQTVDLPLTPSPTSRREFCAHACQAASLMALAGVAAGCGGSGSPTSPSSGAAPAMPVAIGTVSGRIVTVTAVTGGALGTNGSAALIQTSIGSFVAVRIADNSANVFTAVCTHESCTITGFQNARFVCPCHGSQFTTNGTVANGPATRALQQFPSQFASGVLTFTA
jgi:cytochrome b6-f complex iron-sulfur subunit